MVSAADQPHSRTSLVGHTRLMPSDAVITFPAGVDVLQVHLLRSNPLGGCTRSGWAQQGHVPPGAAGTRASCPDVRCRDSRSRLGSGWMYWEFIHPDPSARSPWPVVQDIRLEHRSICTGSTSTRTFPTPLSNCSGPVRGVGCAPGDALPAWVPGAASGPGTPGGQCGPGSLTRGRAASVLTSGRARS